MELECEIGRLKEKLAKYPKKLEWYEELERKFNLAFDEVIKLKEESRNLKFRLADEQDEVNRINGEWFKDKQKIDKMTNWYARAQGEVTHEQALEMIAILESK